MKKTLYLVLALVLFSSHDMFLKLETYMLSPNTPSQIQLFNGTFDKSDNVITRDRMVDVSLVGNGERIRVDTTQWSEEDGKTILSFTTGAPGTWVAGVSTRARNIEMAAADFNDYLEHDGVIDMLEARKANNTLDQDAVEKYSKHVKTIFQVGDKLTQDWLTPMGYPIEFVPMSNPYDLHPGHAMSFQLLWQGQPLANQLVYAGYRAKAHDHQADHDHGHSHSHEEDHSHEHKEALQFRTNANGEFSLNITHQGIWYLRTIHLTTSEEPGLTHESNWATLTFEVGEGHSHSHETAAHSHEEEDHFHIPPYVYWGGSFLLILGLFFWFNRKGK
jgi:hypothetical protein